jgi:predicted SprT family Zn-dependent metalloprotease
MNTALAADLARSLMAEHGLDDWTFVWTKAHSFAGDCNYQLRRIRLSAPWTKVNDETEVRDTILHEIAHALCVAAQEVRTTPDTIDPLTRYEQPRLF